MKRAGRSVALLGGPRVYGSRGLHSCSHNGRDVPLGVIARHASISPKRSISEMARCRLHLLREGSIFLARRPPGLSAVSGLLRQVKNTPTSLSFRGIQPARNFASLRGTSEVAQAMEKRASEAELKAFDALQDGDLTAATQALMRSLETVQRMIKDEDNFGDQRDVLTNRLADGLKRLGSIYLRQDRFEEAVLVLEKALKIRERDFEQFKLMEEAQEQSREGVTRQNTEDESPVERQRKQAQAENLIDYSFTMSLLCKAQLMHLKSVRRKYKYQPPSDEVKAIFLETAEETARNLETANFILSTSLIEDVAKSFSNFLPDANSKQSDYLDQAISRAQEEKINKNAKSLNSLNFWQGNLFEQKLLQAKIENAVQRAELHNSAKEHEQALKILASALRDTSRVFENYLEGLSSLSSPVVARLISHIVETRRLILKEKEKPVEIKDDEGEEEVGWIITNPRVHDFLDKGDILLGLALQVLRHRHNAFANPSNEVKQFESLSLWEGEEALAKCLYNQGLLSLMRDTYFRNLSENFTSSLPDENEESEVALNDLVDAFVREDGLLGENAMWEAYQIRKRYHGNDATHLEALRCLIPLARSYNRHGNKHDQVISLLEPVLKELESQQQKPEAEDKREWMIKCLGLLAEAKEQASQWEDAEKLRMQAIQMLKQTRGIHDYETVQALRSLAANFVQREQYPEAEKLLKAVLKSWKLSAERGLDVTYELVDVLHDLGTVQSDLKQTKEADESFRLAMEIARGGLSESMKGKERKKIPEVNLPTLTNTVGWFLYTSHKLQEAAPLLEEGITALERKDRMLKKLIEDIRDVLEKVESEEKQEMTEHQQDEWIGAEIGRDGLNSSERQETPPTINPDAQHEAAKIITEPLEAEMEMNARQLMNNMEALVEIYTMKGGSPERILSHARRVTELMEELIARGCGEEAELVEPLQTLAHALQANGQDGEASKVLKRAFALSKKHRL